MNKQVIRKIGKIIGKVPKKKVSKKNRIDVGSASSNINNAESSNTEWVRNLSAKNKGKEKASTSSVSFVELDIEMTGNIVARLQNKMELTSQQDMTECCICRVPNSFRNVNSEAYTPQLISIGPLHRGDGRLKDMEEQKLRYFKEFAERYGMDQKKIKDLVICIQEKEAYIRACYSENFNEIESSDFIEMILLDAVFIIEFLKDSNDGHSPNLKPWMIFDIREDLMLLENQLPFFIIEEIYDKACHARQEKIHDVVRFTDDEETKHDKAFPFLNLATVHFGKYMFSQGGENPFLMLKLLSFLLTFLSSQSLSCSFISALICKLKLLWCTVPTRPTMKIGFLWCTVHQPADWKRINFLQELRTWKNDIEQARASNMENDIEEARATNMEEDKASDDAAVSNMINNLCKNIGDNDTCFDDISQEINAHYENRCNHRKATLKLVYFPNIWRGTGTVAAAILLILTLIQTIRTFLLEKDKFTARASNMKNHVEQASASNMEDYVSSSQKKGKGFDVVGSDSDIDYKDINNACTTNSERDDNKILAQLNDKMKELSSKQNRDHCCIYRVPKSLRNVNWKAYTPLLISVGPLHREIKRIQTMQNHKWRCFKEFTEQDGMNKEKIRDLVVIIQNKEKYIRFCYSEKFNQINSCDFIEMILLDAVFIIEFLKEYKHPKNFEPRMMFDIKEDLILLENQLPFSIIWGIYSKINHDFQDVHATWISFLDLVTDAFGKNTGGSFLNRLKYSAVMLRKAGVRFQVTRDECLVNITFDKGV
uniref:Uncharacterized protein n=1 Tax=Salix viminalis TaxID=40686 RepID=A0A6N2MTL1_SALVM